MTPQEAYTRDLSDFKFSVEQRFSELWKIIKDLQKSIARGEKNSARSAACLSKIEVIVGKMEVAQRLGMKFIYWIAGLLSFIVGSVFLSILIGPTTT